MTLPRLTFFCELEPVELQRLFDNLDLGDLAALNATLSLGIMDFSPERAEVVQRLNQAGIPVIAWLLLPKEQGYWFNLDNVSQAVACYNDFKVWTAQYGLRWAGLGLDIEPDIRELEQFMTRTWSLLPNILRRFFNHRGLRQAQRTYTRLVAEMHADGYRVDSYIHPVIVDERKAGSTLLRRLTGVVDVPVNREVWMVYTSQFRSLGVGLLGSYGPEAQSLALGVTGGGVDLGIGDPRPLTWEEFSRDLRLAWYWCEDIHVFSLEGCVEQGFLKKMVNFAWDQPILIPETAIQRVNNLRSTLSTLLWLSVNLKYMLLGALAAVTLVIGLRRYLQRK